MRAISIIFFILTLLWSTSSLALEVSLSAKERSGTSRTNEPITFGVPIAENEGITSTSSLAISGQDAQFKVLSRYHGPPSDNTKPIRVVLVDFQDSITANGTNIYTLSNTGAGQPSGTNLADDKGADIAINTGSAEFHISKTSGNIFDSVSIGTTEIISSPTDDKFTIVYNGETYYSVPTSIIIEENGPLRCVVKVDGEFENRDKNKLLAPVAAGGVVPDVPIRYTIRYFAYKDKSYIKLQATLKNENKGWQSSLLDYTQPAYLTQAYLRTTLNGLAKSKTVSFDGYSDTSTSDTYELLQRETSDGSTPSYAWSYTIEKNGATVSTGTRYDGYADVRDTSFGLMVADRWFWQNHPVGVTVAGNRMDFNLWPNMGADHRILGGMWKTHELLYYFHDNDATFVDELAFLKKKIVLKPTDTYLANTNFFWGLAPESITSGYTFPAGESLDKVLIDHGKKSQAQVDNSLITNINSPNSILDIREKRLVKLSSDPLEYATWYGWLHFGGMPRSAGFGYHNQHYDWAYLGLLNWLRFDNWANYDFAQELLMHKTNVLVLHHPDANSEEWDMYQSHGGQRYELDALLSYDDDQVTSFNVAPLKCSHFWTKDLTMQYYLSGEKLYYESATQGFDHVVRVKDSARMNNSEIRNAFRGIDALVNGYQLTGNTTYLDVAWELWAEALAPYEGGNCTDFRKAWTCTSDETSGYLRTGNPAGSWDMGVGGDAWMVEPLLKMLFELEAAGETAKASSLTAFLNRWSSWVKNTLLPTEPAQGTYGAGKTTYTPYAAQNYWDEETKSYVSGILNLVYLQPYADLFAWRYIQTGSTTWLNLARTLLKDSTWYNTSGSQPVNSAAPGGVYGFGGEGNLSSGTWKVPKAYTKPQYYMRVEAGLEGKTPAKYPAPPAQLRISP